MKPKIVLTTRHLRVFITMDQLAKKLKTCRSAIDNAIDRFLNGRKEAIVFQTKMIRTGKRGPATKAVRVARADRGGSAS